MVVDHNAYNPGIITAKKKSSHGRNVAMALNGRLHLLDGLPGNLALLPVKDIGNCSCTYSQLLSNIFYGYAVLFHRGIIRQNGRKGNTFHRIKTFLHNNGI